MQIIYIHGANATPASFNYIKQYIGDGYLVSYDSQDGFKKNLAEMHEKIAQFNDIVFIGHSLGGIYAFHLANLMPRKIRQGITLSTPYGGHELADYAKMFLPFNALLKDIGPSSWPIKELGNIENKWVWCNVVTTCGNIPWTMGPNDGVVTLESMKHRRDIELIAMECNHYEVLQNPATIEIIANRLETKARERDEITISRD